jgi:hypothetical protein
MKRSNVASFLLLIILNSFINCNNSNPDRIALPVCPCILKGTKWTAISGRQGEWIQTGNTDLTFKVSQVVYEANDNVWIPGADIAMVPQISDDGYIKVIDDPDLNFGDPGDVYASDEEGSLLASKCREVWAGSIVEGGLVLIIANKIINSDGSRVGMSGYSENYKSVLARNSGLDLCNFPRNLSKNDLLNRYMIIEDPMHFGLKGEKGNGIPNVILAHEFGHVLMLGHGDGLDNDNNGKQPGENGPRLFDAYCDFNEYKQFDEQPTQPRSLMNMVAGGNTTITPLQRECARNVAVLLPGAAGPK